MQYKNYTTLQQRREEVEQLRGKFPDRVPAVVEPLGETGQLPRLTKCKYLVPADFRVSSFLAMLRMKLKIPREKALYLFVGDQVLPQTSDTFAQLHARYADPEDGFLYILYEQESAFG